MPAMKKIRLTLLSFIMAVTATMATGLTAYAAENIGWASAKGKPAQERLEIYEQLQVEIDDLYLGKILSVEPLVIVSHHDSSDPIHSAVLRIWTGMISRHGDNLQMSWDELTYDADGDLWQAVPDLEAYIEDYFQAADQTVFHQAEYLGILPWSADLPTDREAEARKIPILEDLVLYNMYDVPIELPEGVEIDYGDTEAITLHTQVPDYVRMLMLPPDALSNWALEHIVHLWNLGIIKGYPDHTIRPEGTLKRSEFVALLVRALELPKDGVTLYRDAAGTWVEGEVAAAEQAGIIPRGLKDDRFRPNDDITRIEMVEMLYHAVRAYGIEATMDQRSFSDVSGLNSDQQEALTFTTQIGIIAGYADGTFRPMDRLQRAEAFKVISMLLQMI